MMQSTATGHVPVMVARIVEVLAPALGDGRVHRVGRADDRAQAHHGGHKAAQHRDERRHELRLAGVNFHTWPAPGKGTGIRSTAFCKM